MDQDSNNPFESPGSEPSAGKAINAPLIAMVCPIVIGLAYALFGVIQVLTRNYSLAFPIIVCTTSATLGIAQTVYRTRFIWRLSRWFTGLLAATHTLFVLLVLCILVRLAVASDFFTYALPEVEYPDMHIWVQIAIIGVVAAVAIPWFFALNSPRTRRLFNLVCNDCGSKKLKSRTFTLRRVECKECGHIW